MCWRRKTPFAAAFFHRFPLRIDVERERAGISFHGHQLIFLRNDKAETGNPLDTFVGAAD